MSSLFLTLWIIDLGLLCPSYFFELTCCFPRFLAHLFPSERVNFLQALSAVPDRFPHVLIPASQPPACHGAGHTMSPRVSWIHTRPLFASGENPCALTCCLGITAGGAPAPEGVNPRLSTAGAALTRSLQFTGTALLDLMF